MKMDAVLRLEDRDVSAKIRAGWPAAVVICAMVFASACASIHPVAPRARQEARGPDFSGIWWVERASSELRPADGGPIPFSAAGQAAYDGIRTGLRTGKIVDQTHRYCLPDGLPRLLNAPYPFEVALTPDQATFLHEARHVYRGIPLNVGHPPDAKMLDAYMGNAVAHWESDTLVIDSVRFNDETWLDSTGLPHSSQLHEIERWRKIDGGARLEDRILIEDPVMFTKPWTVRITFLYRPDVTLMEYVCGEPHRAVSASGDSR
jgi:hypothetical protein